MSPLLWKCCKKGRALGTLCCTLEIDKMHFDLPWARKSILQEKYFFSLFRTWKRRQRPLLISVQKSWLRGEKATVRRDWHGWWAEGERRERRKWTNQRRSEQNGKWTNSVRRLAFWLKLRSVDLHSKRRDSISNDLRNISVFQSQWRCWYSCFPRQYKHVDGGCDEKGCGVIEIIIG